MNQLIGRKVKDKITGFVGVVTGHCEYISGCNQVLVVPPVKESGEFVDGHWFDEQRVEIVDETHVALDNSRTPGPDKTPSRTY